MNKQGGFRPVIHIFLVVALFLLSLFYFAFHDNPAPGLAMAGTQSNTPPFQSQFSQVIQPQQNTTGPRPSLEVIQHNSLKTPDSSENVLSESVLSVPAYLWRHGCGPTAVGMVVGYYDLNGFPDLIPGSAQTQTDEVNQAIASGGDYGDLRPSGQEGNFEDYAMPIDSDTSQPILQDSYLTGGRSAHEDNSIADFMNTSRSTIYNRYGWSWSSDIAPAFTDFARLRNPSYQTATNIYPWPALTWSILTSEIDNGRPMVFLVDSDGDGQTDHFVTVVGYRTSPTLQYASWDTWDDTSVRWENFAGMSSGTYWGIWGGWTFSIADTSDYIYSYLPLVIKY